MSLATNVQNAVTAIGTALKATRTLINGNAADLSGLTTTNKTNLVAAINEVVGSVGGAGASINDATTTTTSVWSSSKTNTSINSAVAAVVNSAPATLDTLAEIGDALGDDPNFATTITTALGNRVRYDAAQTLTGPQATQARSNIGAGTSNLVIGTGAGQAADAAALATSLSGKANTSHTHTASQISDSTVTGRSLLTTTDASTARTAIGAGTSNLVIGTTAGTAADAGALATSLSGKAATTHTHTASQISDSTTVGRNVLVAADALAARTAIGAGTGNSNLVIGTTAGTAADAAALATSLALKEDKANIGNTDTDFVATFNAALV